MLDNLSIKDFLRDLASSLPAPGGGSAAALSAALAGALNAMVFSLTVGKKAYNELEDVIKDEIQNAFNKSLDTYKDACSYMEKDKNAFLKVMEAYKLPKSNEEEKAKRDIEINKALVGAMEVPFELMKLSLGFYDFIEIACKYGNKNAISDAGVAAIMLHGAIESAYLNVKINIASIKDFELGKKISDESNRILEISKERKEMLLTKVHSLIFAM